MAHLFGRDYTRAELEAECAGLNEVFGITHLTRSDGTRVLQVETGGGLRVDVLPDRCCDIGAVWYHGIPFFWSGPSGPVATGASSANTPLYGLLQTCGFDHIRQPEEHEGRLYPLHGSILHRPSRIMRAAPEWSGDDCSFIIEAEVDQFALDRGGVRLLRRLSFDLGGRSIRLNDQVTVTAGEMPIMAMYHFNLGFPTFGATSSFALNVDDISGESLTVDGITTRHSGVGKARARLADGTGRAAINVEFDADVLPILQTLCDSRDGVGLFCIEPATHDRKLRSELEETLVPTRRGECVDFAIQISFE